MMSARIARVRESSAAATAFSSTAFPASGITVAAVVLPDGTVLGR
jgi:hypothetical protein